MENPVKGSIFTILDGKKQFVIPVYQRIYSWEKEQCDRLWQDIISMQRNDKKGHFIGSIVNIVEKASPAGISTYMIIDGQQRMTTLTLLLIALRDYVKTKNNIEINPEEINDTYLKNKYGKGDEHYKLVLTKDDKEVLIKLIEQTPLEGVNSRIIDNYNYFLNNIKKNEISPELVYDAIGKLQIVNITLERNVDDAQAIFESLNSTGKELHESDLIRNNMLMSLSDEEQKDLYDQVWYPMERLFTDDEKEEFMDRFFRDYITMETVKIPNINQVYDEFQIYKNDVVININLNEERMKKVEYGDKSDNYVIADVLSRRLYTFAQIYTNMILCKSNDNELLKLYIDVRDLNMDVVYPFLLQIHEDFQCGEINNEELKDIIKMCINYVFRRAICNIPTNSLNKTFSTLKTKINYNDYVNSIKAYFVLCEDYKRYPTDEEFIKNFIVEDIYHKKVKKFCLSHLENFDNKSAVDIEKLTIEHIMPQNEDLSKEWRDMLGNDWERIHREYLHTIGNLTLTAYNSELSDKPFLDKMNIEGGFKQSALKLNSYVVTLTEWNEDTIKKRAEILSNMAIEIWNYPKLSFEVIEKYKENEKKTIQYSIDDYDYNAFNKMLFDCLDKKILSLSPLVKREFKKKYVAYKLETNFVDVVFQSNRLRLAVNMKYDEVVDVDNICKDISNVGRWGNGEVEVFFEHTNEIEKVMNVIKQSYHKQLKQTG